MSPKSRRFTVKEVIKILRQNGFEDISQTGSHIKFFNMESRKPVIVPFHQGKTCPLAH